MAYSPDDDRFYDALNGAGRLNIDQRGRVAEDQAATTRELGQIYGNLPLNALKAGMAGADWRMKREKDQQSFDQNQAEEGRHQAEEGRHAQTFTDAQTDRADKLAQIQKERAYEGAAAEESYARGAGVDYQAGMTHKDVNRMADANKMGEHGRDYTQRGVIATGVQEGETTRNAATTAAAKSRQDEMIAFDREKVASQLAAEKYKVDHKEEKPATDAELKVASFGRRAQDANDIIRQLEVDQGYDAADKRKTGRNFQIPLVGTKPWATEQDRAYDAAKSEFIDSVMRPDSGAVLGPRELETKGEALFPEPGDPPNIIAQKRARRDSLANTLMMAAGDKAGQQVKNQHYDVPAPTSKKAGTAIAAPAHPAKPVDQMSYDEVKAQLRALEGGD